MNDDADIFEPGALTHEERIEQLHQILAAVWSNECTECGRPLSPRAAECCGCMLDQLRSGT